MCCVSSTVTIASTAIDRIPSNLARDARSSSSATRRRCSSRDRSHAPTSAMVAETKARTKAMRLSPPRACSLAVAACANKSTPATARTASARRRAIRVGEKNDDCFTACNVGDQSRGAGRSTDRSSAGTRYRSVTSWGRRHTRVRWPSRKVAAVSQCLFPSEPMRAVGATCAIARRARPARQKILTFTYFFGFRRMSPISACSSRSVESAFR